MRILMVTPRFAPLVGGVETHTREVATCMTAAGHRVTILTTDPSGALPPTESCDGVEVRRVRAWPRGRDYYLAPGIYRAITGRAGAWDVVHCQSYHTLVAPLAMLAASRAALPFVVTFHSGGHSSGLRHHARGLQRRLLRPLLARARRLIAVSDFEAQLFQRDLHLPRERFVVVPNGARLPSPRANSPPHASAGPLILSVGRLEAYKGHARAVAALPYLLYRQPQARLTIVGAGPDEPRLRRMIGTLGLSDHVEITSVPAADRQGMAGLLARADLVTLLSDYEAHPIAVMEALALKRPVLVAHTSGLAEFAERGLARSVPATSSPREVADAMLSCLERPLIPADLHWTTWEECADRLLALYRDVLAETRCAS